MTVAGPGPSPPAIRDRTTRVVVGVRPEGRVPAVTDSVS